MTKRETLNGMTFNVYQRTIYENFPMLTVSQAYAYSKDRWEKGMTIEEVLAERKQDR